MKNNLSKHEKIAKRNTKKYVALPHPVVIDYWQIGRPGIIKRFIYPGAMIEFKSNEYYTRDIYILNGKELGFDNQDEAEDFATMLNIAKSKRK